MDARVRQRTARAGARADRRALALDTAGAGALELDEAPELQRVEQELVLAPDLAREKSGEHSVDLRVLARRPSNAP